MSIREATHAEWTKLRTRSSTGWLLLGAVALTVALSAAAAVLVGAVPGQDPTRLSLTGIALGQAVVAVLSVLAIGGEYDTGMIRVTFAAMPRRQTVLAAKAAVVGAVTLVAGAVAVAGCLLVGRLVLPAGGHALAGWPTVRAAAGSVLYLVLIAWLGLGAATAVRSSAAGIGTVLGLLYLFPVLAQAVADREWQRRLEQVGPMTAGLAIQSTTGLDGLAIGPWAGLGVLAAWAAAALLAGGLVLWLRDA
jgi:ABC-2 type transport system permease protein